MVNGTFYPLNIQLFLSGLHLSSNPFDVELVHMNYYYKHQVLLLL